MKKKQRPPGPDISQLAQLLAGQARAVAEHYLPGGKVVGPRYFADGLHGGQGTKLSVCLTTAAGPVGRWQYFPDETTGDMVDLIAHSQGLSLGEAAKEAKAFLGLSADAPAPARQAPLMKQQAQQLDESARRKRGLARRIWRDSVAIAGTFAEEYLRSRGITCALPASLRFVPDLDYYSEVDREVIHRGPGMVSVMSCARRFCALHMTYLQPDGSGGWEKLKIPDPAKIHKWAAPKKILASPGEGIIWLSPVGQKLAVAEGIENSLSWGQDHPEWSLAAAGSVSLFKRFRLPAIVEELLFLGDGDSTVVQRLDGSRYVPAREATLRARDAHAERRRREGMPLKSCAATFTKGGDLNAHLTGAEIEPPKLTIIKGGAGGG